MLILTVKSEPFTKNFKKINAQIPMIKDVINKDRCLLLTKDMKKELNI